MYHCERGSNLEHKTGYDLCDKCIDIASIMYQESYSPERNIFKAQRMLHQFGNDNKKNEDNKAKNDCILSHCIDQMVGHTKDYLANIAKFIQQQETNEAVTSYQEDVYNDNLRKISACTLDVDESSEDEDFKSMGLDIAEMEKIAEEMGQIDSPSISNTTSSLSLDDSLFNSYSNNLYENDTDNIRIVELVNSFHHLLRDHSDKFEEIHYKLIEECNDGRICKASDCFILKRNNRNRAKYATNDQALKRLYFDCDNNNDIVNQQIMDSIHCHYFHSFDNGYKLSQNDKLHIQQMIVDAEYKNDDIDTINDPLGTAIFSFISKKIKLNTRTVTKFTSSFSNKKIKYRFGIKFFYWKYYQNNIGSYDISAFRQHPRNLGVQQPDPANHDALLGDFYVESKYKDLKQELVNNNICRISLHQWHVELLKAAQKHRSEKYKSQKPGGSKVFCVSRMNYKTVLLFIKRFEIMGHSASTSSSRVF